jgi:AI-2 transport protein TqsA
MSVNGADPPAQSQFQARLTIATLALLFVVLVIHLLQLFASILQPLLIAALVLYVLYPVQRWLVQRGVRPILAHVLMLVFLTGLFVIVGQAVYSSAASLTPSRLDEYRGRLERLIDRAATEAGYHGAEAASEKLRRVLGSGELSGQEILGAVRRVAGSFFGALTFALVVFIYLVFLMAERVTFPRRLALTFGETRASRLQQVVGNINEAIGRYVAVKAWISFVTGALSLAVFAGLGIDFAVLWGLLIFLLNFIPYLGGLVAMGPPILLGFLQFDSPWRGIAVVVSMVAIQLFTGQYLEPKMAGRKLNLSPLLILLALAFWGYLWGVVGMILAVPLTVVCKIILDHIPETRPISTLMSNM